MNALIIEDDELKLSRIRKYLEYLIRDVFIDTARSYKSGLRSLVDCPRELVLMDMTIPSFDITPGTDGGRPLNLGGKELLRQMRRRSIAYPTIVITGFDNFGVGQGVVTLFQLDQQLRSEFPTFYLGSVYFNATSDDWKDDLKKLLKGSAMHEEVQ